jgi:putative serine protease PepD
VDERTMVELAVVDLNSATGVAAAVVLVVTPQGNTSGVLVDRDGHILTNWHTVHDYDAVVVMFKQAGGSLPAYDSLVRARVVAHSKFADLALLKAESIPAAIEPVTIAAKVEAQSGAPIHAIGHAGGRDSNRQWQHGVANLNRVRRGSSWYSTQRVLHRADVIRATMNLVQDFAGAPLFNNQLELIGLGAMVREEKGEIVGISASTIRVFLAGSSG